MNNPTLDGIMDMELDQDTKDKIREREVELKQKA